MITMIKYSIESFFELHRKCLDGRILRVQVCMTNNADSLLLSDPLIHMAANAGVVSAELTLDAARLTAVTDIALKL